MKYKGPDGQIIDTNDEDEAPISPNDIAQAEMLYNNDIRSKIASELNLKQVPKAPQVAQNGAKDAMRVIKQVSVNRMNESQQKVGSETSQSSTGFGGGKISQLETRMSAIENAMAELKGEMAAIRKELGF